MLFADGRGINATILLFEEPLLPLVAFLPFCIVGYVRKMDVLQQDTVIHCVESCGKIKSKQWRSVWRSRLVQTIFNVG